MTCNVHYIACFRLYHVIHDLLHLQVSPRLRRLDDKYGSLVNSLKPREREGMLLGVCRLMLIPLRSMKRPPSPLGDMGDSAECSPYTVP